MKRQAMNDLYDRSLRALRGERPEGNAESGAVPVARYVDGARLDREIAVTRRFPQAIAPSSELPTPGSWVSRDRGGVPILLVRQADHAQVSVLDPRSPAMTMVHEVTLIPKAPESEKAVRHWQANVDLYRRTLLEDYSIAETIQAGLRSGANTHLSFGTFELSIPRFHAQLERELDQS